jgi:hypothetical protein
MWSWLAAPIALSKTCGAEKHDADFPTARTNVKAVPMPITIIGRAHPATVFGTTFISVCKLAVGRVGFHATVAQSPGRIPP